MPTPYEQSGYIGGVMPQMAQAGAITGSPGDLQAGYEQAYNSALGQNTALYNNILAGYQNVAAGQRSAQDAIAAGYPQLAGRIQDQLAGTNAQVQGQLAGTNAQVQGQIAGANAQAQAQYGDLREQLRQRGEQTQGDYGAVGQNVQNYLGWMGGALGEQYAREGYVGRGYQNLQGAVLGDIALAGQTQARNIQQQYNEASAATRQSAIDRGLGNTTVQDTMQRGVELDRARAGNQLAEQLGNLRAGYRSQLGQAQLGFNERQMGVDLAQQNLLSQSLANAAGQYGTAGLQARQGYDLAAGGYAGQAAGLAAQAGMTGAGYTAGIGQAGAGYTAGIGQAAAGYGAGIGQAGLGYQGQAAQNNTNLALNQLGWMNTVSAPYPNAGQYMQAAQIAGAAQAAQQANRNPFANAPVGGGGVQMMPGTGRGVPSSPLSLSAGGYPEAGGGGGYHGPAVIPGMAGQTTYQAGVTGPQPIGGGVFALTGGTRAAPQQPAPAAATGGYNPPSGFGGGFGGYGGNQPVDEYGMTEADWQNAYAPEAGGYNWLSDLGAAGEGG